MTRIPTQATGHPMTDEALSALAEGYVATLRQLAKWTREATSFADGVPDDQKIDIGDVDADELDATADLIAALLARVKELEGALKPFADYIEPDRGMFPDHMPITSGSSIAHRQLTMADCRLARAVVEKG